MKEQNVIEFAVIDRQAGILHHAQVGAGHLRWAIYTEHGEYRRSDITERPILAEVSLSALGINEMKGYPICGGRGPGFSHPHFLYLLA